MAVLEFEIQKTDGLNARRPRWSEADEPHTELGRTARKMEDPGRNRAPSM